MFQDERNPLFLQYLHQRKADLEQKLLYPKNDWRRKAQLSQELDDVTERIQSFERQNSRVRRTDRRAPSRYRHTNDRGFNSSRPTVDAIAANY